MQKSVSVMFAVSGCCRYRCERSCEQASLLHCTPVVCAAVGGRVGKLELKIARQRDVRFVDCPSRHNPASFSFGTSQVFLMLL